MNVTTWPIGAITKLNVIAKIRKYKKLHEGHHFIPIIVEVHNVVKHYMNRFITKCAHILHDRQSGDHLFLYFCIQFFKFPMWWFPVIFYSTFYSFSMLFTVCFMFVCHIPSIVCFMFCAFYNKFYVVGFIIFQGYPSAVTNWAKSV